jgi:hypothetical protein
VTSHDRKPICQFVEVARERCEGADGNVGAVGVHRRHVHRSTDIERGGTGVDQLQVLIVGLLLWHGILSRWQEGVGYAIRSSSNRDHRRRRRHHSQVRMNPWATFFNGVDATNKLTAAASCRAA